MATVQALVSSSIRFMIDLSDRIKEHGYSASLGVKPYEVMIDLSDRIKEHGYSASLGVKPYEVHERPI